MFLCAARRIVVIVALIAISACVFVPAASAQTRDQNVRMPIKSWSAGDPIRVPTVLLVQLKKDLGDDQFLPKTVDQLAEQLETEKLSLVDPRSAVPTRSFPQDAEFYWLWGPAGMCGSGGCSAQLYWASPSSGRTGRLFPTTQAEDGRAFNKSPTVLTRSANGLFDVALSQASGSDPALTRPFDTTLTFDGQRYVVQITKKH